MATHPHRIPEPSVRTLPSPAQKAEAAKWFEALQTRFCAMFEGLEHEYGSQEKFTAKTWQRQTEDQSDGGGGVMKLLKGALFEKAGVNASTVYGAFSKEFRAQIPGAENDGKFWASGLSMVIHPAHPRVPALHMNTRHIVTKHGWFGAAADLNPVFPVEEDTGEFHAALKQTLDAQSPDFYPRYKQWCDEYFFIPHRNRARGVGGIFYDYHDTGSWADDFALTKAVGEAVLAAYPVIARRRMKETITEADREAQLMWRGYYAEFNLVYDRGTKFGLATGGNPEAILMSLPPVAKWP